MADKTEDQDGAKSIPTPPKTPLPVTEPDAPAPVVADTTEEARPNMAELTGIKYTGGHDVRSLSVADLKTLGVDVAKSEDGLTWSAANDFIVPIAEVNAATVDALRTLPEFELV